MDLTDAKTLVAECALRHKKGSLDRGDTSVLVLAAETLAIHVVNLQTQLKPIDDPDVDEMIESLKAIMSTPWSPEGQVICGAQDIIKAQARQIAKLEASLAEGEGVG